MNPSHNLSAVLCKVAYCGSWLWGHLGSPFEACQQFPVMYAENALKLLAKGNAENELLCVNLLRTYFEAHSSQPHAESTSEKRQQRPASIFLAYCASIVL